jgi:hypothetical protein
MPLFCAPPPIFSIDRLFACFGTLHRRVNERDMSLHAALTFRRLGSTFFLTSWVTSCSLVLSAPDSVTARRARLIGGAHVHTD